MAKKKSVRKASPKASTKKVSKKKSVAKKSKPASSSKSSGTAEKGRAVKASSKPRRKGKISLKNAIVSTKKITPQKPSFQKSVVTKKKGVTETKNVVNKAQGRSASTSLRLAEPKTRVDSLSPTERYNLGGLFACAIERTSDPDFKRLRAVFRHLDLPSQETDNLLRLSQGFTIPKLFADGVGEHKVGQILADFITFASGEGAYEKKWRDEIRQVGMWLGYFPQQVEQIEQTVLGKR